MFAHLGRANVSRSAVQADPGCDANSFCNESGAVLFGTATPTLANWRSGKGSWELSRDDYRLLKGIFQHIKFYGKQRYARIPFEVSLPKALTSKTLKESKRGKNMKSFGTREAMYRDLGL